MGIKAIEDEFTGKGTAIWRYQQRRKKAGLCVRCGKGPLEDARANCRVCLQIMKASYAKKATDPNKG
jgi:hypothetical protein